MENPPAAGTPSADVYSFAIVLSEILTRDMPFGSFNKMPQGERLTFVLYAIFLTEIVNLVRAGLDPPFRPDITDQNDADMNPSMTTLMRDCWLEDPKLRPDFKHIRAAVRQMNRNR